MQYNNHFEAPQPTQESGASLLELKQAYQAGLLVTTVTPDMINEQLITAVFEDVEPIKICPLTAEARPKQPHLQPNINPAPRSRLLGAVHLYQDNIAIVIPTVSTRVLNRRVLSRNYGRHWHVRVEIDSLRHTEFSTDPDLTPTVPAERRCQVPFH